MNQKLPNVKNITSDNLGQAMDWWQHDAGFKVAMALKMGIPTQWHFCGEKDDKPWHLVGLVYFFQEKNV